MYTTWPEVCGHLTSNIPSKIMALIWSWSTLCCYNNLRSSGKALYYRCWSTAAGICFHSARSSLVRSGTDWAISPDLHLAFQLIPKVLDGVEVRTLCRPVKFIRTDLYKTISIWTLFCARGYCHAERAFPKLLPQSWKQRIVCCVIALTFAFPGTKGPSPKLEKQPGT
uniref:Uncharacterized protein n=1 Tax=Anguilla anguilla TaxID=7936 RepID=A0A0E9WTX1_ANGAN